VELKLSEQKESRRVSHVARNPEAAGAKGDRLALCGRIVLARELTAQPAPKNCCAKCRQAWLTSNGPWGRNTLQFAKTSASGAG
jgi:hypothetical protein